MQEGSFGKHSLVSMCTAKGAEGATLFQLKFLSLAPIEVFVIGACHNK